MIDCGAPSLLQNKLSKARELGAELPFIDTPPHADAIARQAAKLADLILIPCRPKAFDLAAIEATAELLRPCHKRAFVVLMAGSPKAPLMYKEAADVIEGSFGLSIAPVTLLQRAAFHHSTAHGQAAALWRWRYEQLNMATGEHVHSGALAG